MMKYLQINETFCAATTRHFPCLLGDVWLFPAQCRVDGYRVTLCCWGLGCVGGQNVRDVALATLPTQEVLQHTAGLEHVSGDVKETAEAVRHQSKPVFC